MLTPCACRCSACWRSLLGHGAARSAQDEAARSSRPSRSSPTSCKNVGGDRVEVTTLVGPERRRACLSADARATRRRWPTRKVVFVNGLGFEGWIARLVKASGTKAPMVVAAKGVQAAQGRGRARPRPRRRRSACLAVVANAKIYVANIRDGLIAADPAGKAAYEANAAAYLAKLDALDAEVKAAVDEDPRRPPQDHHLA